jgi:hypothetical protein
MIELHKKLDLGKSETGHDSTVSESHEVDFFLDEGEDPINRLGFGIISYFQMVKALFILMVLLSLFNLPLMFTYGSYDALKSGGDWLSSTYFLGNMGQISTQCASSKLIGGQIEFSCNTGVISKIIDFGVYGPESQADLAETCSSKAGLDTNMPDCSYLSDKSDKMFKGKILDSCLEKALCFIDIKDYLTIGQQKGHPKCEIDQLTTVFVQY